MKKVLIITMGGTISAQGKNRMDLKDYQSGVYGGKTFLRDIVELNQLADIDIHSLDNVSSTEINASHWISLRNKVTEALSKEGYDGIVITHGTNTLEETAYFLHLTVPTDKPIILVGAQRPYTAMSSDASLNIMNAVRVAIDKASQEMGVLVVLNNEISSARDVTKSDTYSLDAFHSGKLGFLGFIAADYSIQYYRKPLRKHTVHSQFAHLSISSLPNVEIIYSYAGASDELINHVIACKKYDGIIMAGTGAGRFSNVESNALSKAVNQGIHVVRGSRVGGGNVVDIHHYKNLHAITSDNLSPQKARILLMLSLLLNVNQVDIQKIFNTY